MFNLVRRDDRDVQVGSQRVGDLEEQRLLHHRAPEGHRGDGEGEGHRGEEDRTNAAQSGGPEPGADVERRQEVEVGEGEAKRVSVAEVRAEGGHQPCRSENGKAGTTSE